VPLAEPIEVALQVGSALDALGVEWLVGGSVASSLHGIPRATQDIDLVAALQDRHVLPLVAALEADFYIDADMIRGALQCRGSFNLIHLATMTKVDIFAPRGDPLSRLEMGRRRRYALGDAEGRSLPLASPEDIILQKLHWFRKGGAVSERQWRDVLGVLKIQSPQLDLKYLEDLAEATGLARLLHQATEAAK